MVVLNFFKNLVKDGKYGNRTVVARVGLIVTFVYWDNFCLFLLGRIPSSLNRELDELCQRRRDQVSHEPLRKNIKLKVSNIVRRRARGPKSTVFQVAIFPYSGTEKVS